MKQHITKNQLHEFSSKGVIRLWEWMTQKGYWPKDLFMHAQKDMAITAMYAKDSAAELLPTIGQMIEFLEENPEIKGTGDDGWFEPKMEWYQKNGNLYFDLSWSGGELCDALWAAVKEILEKKEV